MEPASSLDLCLEVDPGLSLLGWQVDVEASGDVALTSFSFIPSMSSHVSALKTHPTHSLKLNWLYEDPTVPWAHGITCFGTLELRPGSGSWDLQVQATSHESCYNHESN